MPPALLFDFDGTIADTFDLAMSIGKNICDSLGLRVVTSDDIVRFRNMPLRAAVRSLRIPFRKIPKILLRIRREIHEHIDDIRPCDGMQSVLEELRSRCDLLGVVTSNSEENVARFLTRQGLDFFDCGAYSSGMFGKSSKLRGLLHRQNLSKDSVLYIGDTVGDVVACRKAGIRVAAVAWGFNSKEVLATANPDFIVSEPRELLAIAASEFT
jgi:phosphoglycolate phosphatase